MSAFVGRDPGPLHLPGIDAADANALGDHLRGLARSGRLLASDVTLGAWRNHHVASELLAQLGRPEATELLSAAEVGTESSAAGLPPRSEVGRRIDRETAGDRSIREAFALANEVVRSADEHAPLTVCILVGRTGLGWEPADAWLVRFLAHGLRAGGHRLVLAAAGPAAPELPSDWIVSWSSTTTETTDAAPFPAESAAALVPGILTPRLAAMLGLAGERAGSAIPLLGGGLLVPPAARAAVEDVPDERFEALAHAAREVPWVAAYASHQQRSGTLGAASLWEHAQRDFDAGGLTVPIRLLERATGRARNGMERAVFTLLAQAARIVSGRFERAAAIDDPDPRLPPELRGWLWHTKGWALAMLDRPEPAEACLGPARELLGSKPTDEHLYVLNISALNRLKAGDWDGANALEQHIRATIGLIPAGHAHLRYINSLNLARLHRRRGDLDASETYYREAFETTRGTPSDSDAIYRNVCLAKLYEARSDSPAALRAWVRAALYWVSSPLPEAIAPRVVAAILASGPPAASDDGFLERVPSILAARLLAHAPTPDRAAVGPAPVFARVDAWPRELAACGPWHALRLAGAWVLGVEADVAPTLESAAHLRLRAVLAQLLEPSGAVPRAILVDDRLGHDLPESEAQLLALALRLGIPSLRRADETIELDAPTRARLEAALRVRVGSAVAHVVHVDDGAVVVLRRYRPPRRIGSEASAVLRRLADGELPVSEVAAPPLTVDRLLPLLRLLERDRIVELLLPETMP